MVINSVIAAFSNSIRWQFEPMAIVCWNEFVCEIYGWRHFVGCRLMSAMIDFDKKKNRKIVERRWKKEEEKTSCKFPLLSDSMNGNGKETTKPKTRLYFASYISLTRNTKWFYFVFLIHIVCYILWYAPMLIRKYIVIRNSKILFFIL